MVEFWRQRGVRGFRFDVINLIGKPEDLPSAPDNVDDRHMYTDGALVMPYLHELALASHRKDPSSVAVGEMSSTSIERCIEYSHATDGALSMVFNFHHLKVDYLNGQKWTRTPFDFAELKRLLSEWAVRIQDGGGWNALFWNNHDQPRALDRFGDSENYRVESATMLATAIHLLRGTPYIYMGEEIGMTDPRYTSIGDYVDVEAINAYEALLAAGCDQAEAFAIVHSKARDNARTPMQWDAGPNAGFSAATPWLRPTNHETINVAAEEAGGRILPYYRKLIRLRKTCAVISEGLVEPYALEHPSIFSYVRTLKGTKLLVLTNFYADPSSIEIPEEFINGKILIENYHTQRQVLLNTQIRLRPYEAIAVLARTRSIGDIQ